MELHCFLQPVVVNKHICLAHIYPCDTDVVLVWMQVTIHAPRDNQSCYYTSIMLLSASFPLAHTCPFYYYYHYYDCFANSAKGDTWCIIEKLTEHDFNVIESPTSWSETTVIRKFITS